MYCNVINQMNRLEAISQVGVHTTSNIHMTTSHVCILSEQRAAIKTGCFSRLHSKAHDKLCAARPMPCFKSHGKLVLQLRLAQVHSRPCAGYLALEQAGCSLNQPRHPRARLGVRTV